MRESRPGGIVVLALGGDDQLQLGMEVERLEALGAVLEVTADVGHGLVAQLPVEEGLQLAQRLVAISHPSFHPAPCVAGCPASPRDSAYSNNDFCIAFLPRCSRDMTVPIGMSRISAISLYEKPSTSASSTGSRKFSGRSSSACLTSSSVSRSNSWSSADRLAASESSAAEAPVEVHVLDVGEIGLGRPPLARAVRVDEGVGEDPEQPRPQVGALGEAAEPAVRPQVGVLHEVLGVGLVARHPQGGRVQLRCVLHRLVGEGCRIGHPATLPGAAVRCSASRRVA